MTTTRTCYVYCIGYTTAEIYGGKYLVFELASMCYSLGVDAEGVHLAARACVGRRLRDGRVGRGG